MKPFKTQRAHCGGHGTRPYLSNKCQVRPTQACVLTVSLTLSATAQWTCWLVRRLLLTPEHSPAALPAHCLSLFQPRSSKNTLLKAVQTNLPERLLSAFKHGRDSTGMRKKKCFFKIYVQLFYKLCIPINQRSEMWKVLRWHTAVLQPFMCVVHMFIIFIISWTFKFLMIQRHGAQRLACHA